MDGDPVRRHRGIQTLTDPPRRPPATIEARYDAILAQDSEMFAVGHYDWHEFNKMVDLHLRFMQQDVDRLLAPLPPQ